MATDPETFKRFHELLTNAEPGYVPFYLKLRKNSKDPVLSGKWKENRLTFEKAYELMKQGYNIGIAGTDYDRLVIVDVDDMDMVGNTKPTLRAISRKQIGAHNYYLTDDKPRDNKTDITTLTAKDNIPVEKAGEVRSKWQYVVAPGSFVPVGPEGMSRIHEEDKANAGKYRLVNEMEPSSITFNELPEVFKSKRVANMHNELENEFRKSQRHDIEPDRYSSSTLFNITPTDLYGAHRGRFPSPLHGSETGKNTSISGDLMHCWRCNVSLSGYACLSVEAGIYDCCEAGKPHNGGSSYLRYDGEEIFTVWKYAKDHNHIHDEDPIPTKALIHYATSNGICKESDIIDGWKLPAEVYNRTLTALRGDGINPGRATVGEVQEEEDADTPIIDLDTILTNIDTSGSVLTRGKNAKADFLKLEKLPISERRLGCKEIWKKYKLGSKEFDPAYKEVFEVIPSANRTDAQQNEPVENDVLDIYTDDVKEYALDILKHGDPFAFILEVVNKYHVGDENIKKLCVVSFGTCHITTSSGLQLKPSGPSGKGKTHVFDNVAIVLPSHRIFRGSMSGMSAYYNIDRLKDGMVFLLDDTDLNRTEGLKNTIKRASSNFQKRTSHLTVVKGKGKEVELPARSLWWCSSVGGVDDDQLGNRFIPIDVDGTEAQDEKVHNWQKNQHLYGLVPDDDLDVQVCRCIYDILGKETYKIVVPFVGAITWNNKDNRRNFPMFLDVVMGITFHYIKQRECVDGVYWATVEDCEKAIEIYGQIEEQNASNLTDEETKLISWMGDRFRANDWLDRNTIQGYLDRSNKYVRDLLHGEDANGGLLSKVPQLVYEKRQVKDDNGTREKVFYRMTQPYHKHGEIVRLENSAVDAAIKTYSHSVSASTTSSALVLKKTSAFSQSVDRKDRPLVLNGSSVRERESHTIPNVNQDGNSNNDICVDPGILAEQQNRTSASRITATDTEKALVQSGTSGELVGTSASRPCLSKEKRQLLAEKIPRWENGNFKITVDSIPRAVIGIANLVRETDTDLIKSFLLEYVKASPVEVTP